MFLHWYVSVMPLSLEACSHMRERERERERERIKCDVMKNSFFFTKGNHKCQRKCEWEWERAKR